MALSPEELSHFQDHGYVVQPSVFSAARCDEMQARLSHVIATVAREYASGVRGEFDFWKLMVRSKHGIEVFWRESGGDLGRRPVEEWERQAMRVGHGLHLADPVFAAFCRAPEIVSTFAQLVAPPVKLIQSAVIYKQPHDQLVQFGSHQDAWYLTTNPESLVLAFVPFDDADLENGCLEVVPGSHLAPVATRMRMTDSGFVPTGTVDRRLETQPTTPLPAPRGSIIFVHGRTWHASKPNRSDRPRRALIVHAMSATSRFAPDCWIQEPAGGFAIVS